MNTKWIQIPAATLCPTQTAELRYCVPPGLDVLDKFEELIAEHGEALVDALAGTMRLKKLGVMQDSTIAALRELVGQLSGKSMRAKALDIFAFTMTEASIDGEWLRLVDEEGKAEGLTSAEFDAASIVFLAYALGEACFGPLFTGLLSKAGEKAETSSDASSTPAAAG